MAAFSSNAASPIAYRSMSSDNISSVSFRHWLEIPDTFLFS